MTTVSSEVPGGFRADDRPDPRRIEPCGRRGAAKRKRGDGPTKQSVLAPGQLVQSGENLIESVLIEDAQATQAIPFVQKR